MTDSLTTVTQMEDEIASLKRRIRELEQSESERIRIEEEFRESEERYRIAIEGSNDGVAISRKGVHVYVNKAFLNIFGYDSFDELIGRPHYCIVHPRDKEKVIAYTSARSRNEYAPSRYEFRGIRKDGTPLDVEVSVNTISYRGETATLAYLRDVTERKKAEEALKAQLSFLQHLIDIIPNPIFYKDRRGLYRGCNRAFEEHVGLPREEILGRSVFEVHSPDTAEIYYRKDADLFESSGTQTYEAVVSHCSGVTRNIIISKAAFNDAAGAVAGLIGVMVDISDRREAEERLRESEQKYRRLFDDAVLGVFQSTPEGKIVTNNPAHARMFGYSSPEELCRAVTDVARDLYADPSLRPSILRMIEETGRSVQIENLYKRKDGSTFVGRLHIWTAPDAKGELMVEGFVEDITEYHAAAKRLRESEEKYRSIFENAVEGMFQSTPEGRFVSVNPAMARMCGYSSPEEMVRSITDIATEHYLGPEDRVRCRNILDTKGRMEKFEHQVRRRNGSPIWVSTNARAVRDASGVALYYEGTMEDITFRKEAEEALRASEANLRTILDSVDDAIVIHAEDGAIIDVNEKMGSMFGVSRAEALSLSIEDDLSGPNDTPEGLRRVWEDVMKGEERFFEWRCRRPRDRSTFYAEVFLRKISLNQSDAILATVHDITDRKEAEEALREKEVFLRQGECIARLGGWKANPESDYLTWTEGVADIMEAPSGQSASLREGLRGSFTPQDASLLFDLIVRAYKDGTPFTREAEATTLRGRRLWVEVRGLTRMEEERGAAVVGTIQDITFRKEAEGEKAHLEAQLRQSQKMEAIGTLAGGVAHDFNNILTTIIGYASLLQSDMYNDDPRKAYMDHILTASQKAANLTQGLLAFSRKQALELKPCKLNEVVKGVGKLLKRLLTEDIVFTLSLTPKDLSIMSDVGQIDQLLMNLATNARDAMPRGGKLTIETKEVFLDRDFVQLHRYGDEGRYALITVSDTGVGMDTLTKEKIFEPFFTTKEVGRGTGLGLSIVYGIVQQHDGYMDVMSEPGAGTTFNIYIPATETRPEKERKPRKEVRGGSECILVAEDDNPLRSLVTELLTRVGYRVMEATDGEDALRMFREHGDAIDLIILDVVMPGKNGKEVYEEVKKTSANKKFLFTSGYTRDVVLDKGIEDSAVDFMRKPLSPPELLLKVREVLDR